MTTEAAAPPEPKSTPAPSDWRAFLLGGQAQEENLSETAKIERLKYRATVRVYEKMNLTDRRPLSAVAGSSSAALCCGLSASDAARVLYARVEAWKKKLRGVVATDGETTVQVVDGELLWHRVWQGETADRKPDGWIYMEAYFFVQDANATYRAIIAPDGSILGY